MDRVFDWTAEWILAFNKHSLMSRSGGQSTDDHAVISNNSRRSRHLTWGHSRTSDEPHSHTHIGLVSSHTYSLRRYLSPTRLVETSGVTTYAVSAGGTIIGVHGDSPLRPAICILGLEAYVNLKSLR